jgi:3-dehydroquinate synthase
VERIKVASKIKTYDILIESGLFLKLPSIFHKNYKGKKIVIVTDNHVYPLYGKKFYEKLTQEGLEVISIVFSAGEENKNIKTLDYIYSILADNSISRSDVIVALGGGVTGDIAGFAAATFLRGTGFVQIPTTLLAMVDSSIGGKVAVDLKQGKNLLGAFYQPDAVYTDPGLLKTLPDREFSNGIAELIKHSFIKDYSLYENLIEIDVKNQYTKNQIDTIEGSINQENNLPDISSIRKKLSTRLESFIAQSCRIKRDIVEEDEYDNGARHLLNFGHTIGHGIEKAYNYKEYTHGEAISIGMSVITALTEKMGITYTGETQKLIKALKLYGLPVDLPPLDKNSFIDAIKKDKKSRSGEITIAYIEKIGSGKLLKMDLNTLEEKINVILENSSRAT